MRRVIEALRPDAKELAGLVRAETDPARYASFEPITAGPAAAVASLAAIGIAGMLIAPIRLLARLRKR